MNITRTTWVDCGGGNTVSAGRDGKHGKWFAGEIKDGKFVPNPSDQGAVDAEFKQSPPAPPPAEVVAPELDAEGRE